MVALQPAAASAQRAGRRAAGLDLVVLPSRPGQVLGGGSLWWRVAQRTRIGGLVAGGVSEGRGIGRAELVGHFLLDPEASRGVAPYAGGGLAGIVGDSRGARLVVVLGVESRPGTPRGWLAEVGLGGGLRLAAGWRWRWGVRR